MLYLDTSLLVTALMREAKTALVQAWLEIQAPDELAISEWVVTEFSAAMSIKLRTGEIAADGRAAALQAFVRLTVESLTVLPISGPHFRAAARLADQHALGLRAGDALHLAVCADHGAALATLDRRLGQAGSELGIMTTLL
jgi:predicted nucleic acid-binding protein